MDVSDFDFDLPAELIAQAPPGNRAEGRLMLLPRAGGIGHVLVSALPSLLDPADLVVVNDTRVFPARLLGRRVPSGGAVECLLLRRLSAGSDAAGLPAGDDAGEQRWEALVHPGQKLKPGALVLFEGAPAIHGEVLERRFHGRRVIRLWTSDGSSIDRAVDAIGHVPLPPYIKRPDEAADRARYQTVFAARRGSIAAPTAGLHFSEALLGAIRQRGIETVAITLHVGYGTFQPVRVTRVEDHRLDAEDYHITPEAAAALNRALDQGRRIVAVGTTSTRALEAAARAGGGRIGPGAAATDLVITPGFTFGVVGGLLTNFHLPRSSLLMLVSAFAGRERVLAAYRAAVDARYRFYSYGDAMLLL
jgi:S-adenosylmethionine:tRNA ribosyltransferase-isomerase